MNNVINILYNIYCFCEQPTEQTLPKKAYSHELQSYLHIMKPVAEVTFNGNPMM